MHKRNRGHTEVSGCLDTDTRSAPASTLICYVRNNVKINELESIYSYSNWLVENVAIEVNVVVHVSRVQVLFVLEKYTHSERKLQPCTHFTISFTDIKKILWFF